MKSIRLGVLWAGIESWGNQLIALTVFTFLARSVPPESFGIVAIAAVVTSFCIVFVDAGWGAALVQRKELDAGHMNVCFWCSLVMASLFVLLAWPAAPFIARWFELPELTLVLRILALSLILTALAVVPSALLQRELAFKALAVRRLVAGIGGGAIGLYLAFKGYGVWALVVKQMLDSLIATLSVWYSCKWRPGIGFTRAQFSDLFQFSLPQAGSQFLVFVNSRLDQLFIGAMLGTHTLGVYAVSRRLILLILDLMTSVAAKVAFPVLAAMQNQPKEYRSFYLSAIRNTSRISFPALLGLAVVSPICVPVVFGEKWTESAAIMQIMAIGSFLQTITIINYTAMVAKGKAGLNLAFHSVAVSIDVLLYVWVVPYGLTTFCIVYSVRLLLTSFISFALLSSVIDLPFRDISFTLAKPLGLSSVMALSVWALQFAGYMDVSLINLFIQVCAGLVVYGVLAAIFYPDLLGYVWGKLELSILGAQK